MHGCGRYPTTVMLAAGTRKMVTKMNKISTAPWFDPSRLTENNNSKNNTPMSSL